MTTPHDYTIEEIKDRLPPVDVLYKGKIRQAMVRGRMNKFASVNDLAEFFIQLEPIQDAKQREQYTWSLASAIQQAVEDWFNTP